MSNQSTTPPSSQDAPPADVQALLTGLRELDGDDRKAADHIANEICKYGVDLLALLGLPFSPGVLAVGVVMSGERAASGPNTIAGWKKYRDEEAPQAVERILNAIIAERSDKEDVQAVVDGLGLGDDEALEEVVDGAVKKTAARRKGDERVREGE